MIVVCQHCNHVFDYTPTEAVKISPVQIYDIIDLCCEHFEVTRTGIFSRFRGGEVVKARHVAMYLIYGEEKNGISLHEIGELFNRDHTSIISARQRCKDAIDTKMDVYKDLLTLSRKAAGIISGLKIAS